MLLVSELPQHTFDIENKLIKLHVYRILSNCSLHVNGKMLMF